MQTTSLEQTVMFSVKDFFINLLRQLHKMVKKNSNNLSDVAKELCECVLELVLKGLIVNKSEENCRFANIY